MGTGHRTFEFSISLLDKKIETLHPYRTASVPDFMIAVRGGDMIKEVEELFKRSGMNVDNHVCFKIESCPLWFWFSDGELRIGTEVDMHSY